MWANSPVIKRAGPLEYFFSENITSGVVTTHADSTTWAVALTLNFTLEEGGVVEFGGSYKWNHNAGANDHTSRVLLDGAPQGRIMQQEPQDAAGDDPLGTGSNQKQPVPVNVAPQFLAAGAHTLALEIQPVTNGINTSVFDCLLIAERKT